MRDLATSKKILVINPNSNESVTTGLRQSLPAVPKGFVVDCCTLRDGPFGIETDQDVARVVPLVVDKINFAKGHDAFVIACYSDPGLADCRREFDQPIFGMQRSALETAVACSEKFGVLALSDESITRHFAYIDKLGFTNQLAGELPLDISVDQAANDPATTGKIISQGHRLIEEFGATTLILGCAGMARHRDAVETALKVAVIEPTQAALNHAIEAA